MDEEQMENQYYRRLRLTNYIFLMSLYAVAFFTLALFISHFNSILIDIIFICGPVILVTMMFIPYIILRKSYGFWYSGSVMIKASFLFIKGFAILTPFFSLSMIAALYIFMPDFFLMESELIVEAIVLFPMGPILYFIVKWMMEMGREKYSHSRAIKIKSDAKKARKLVEDALNNLKLGYREEKEGSKWVGFRDLYVLDSGIRIFVSPLNTSSSSIVISNIPDDDKLEKQIEREILRILALQS